MYKFIHSKVIKILLFTIKSLYSTYLGKGKKIARVISDSAHYASTWTCFALNEKNPNFHWPEETSFANPPFPSSSPYSGEKRSFLREKKDCSSPGGNAITHYKPRNIASCTALGPLRPHLFIPMHYFSFYYLRDMIEWQRIH